MKAVFVKGSWDRNMVQPRLILRFIHINTLGTVLNYDEDINYNVTLYIKNPCEDCLERLLEEFPQYEFTCIG